MSLNIVQFLKTPGDGFNPINRRERRNNAQSRFTHIISLFSTTRAIVQEHPNI